MDEKNRIQNLGEYGAKGGPGRPKGSCNKSTHQAELLRAMLISQFAHIWVKRKGKRWLEDQFKNDPEKVLNLVLRFFPREHGVKVEANVDMKHTDLYRRMAERAGMFDENGRYVGDGNG